ncbi:MAG TPA: hypothetical protein VIK79_03815, partial [Xanthobacteraceae bacterium]
MKKLALAIRCDSLPFRAAGAIQMTSEARFIQADRSQTRWDFIDLEGLLPAEHRARIVWSFV